ncbi:carbonyl reductase [Penicillium atrosanguineum]|uniref:Carbonyl reductase n=1 Tax=Penicillium atrosanguineum TaxID=1132637 RepID=A0A9W9U6W2_9EURO|nr:carbonyl reductase [Penicillium atrosanguineum]
MSTRPLALITGANQGIGLAVAQSLARDHSFRVLIGCRNIDAGEKAASELRSDGHEASAIELDLTSSDSIQAAISRIEKDHGYLDVLINNAGILIDVDTSLSTWDLFQRTFSTNVIGPATLTEGLLPLLRKAEVGPPRLVFVSSIMGSLGVSTDETMPWYNIDYKAYDASKAAVNMLTINYNRILADTAARVNSACPGLVRTQLTGYIEGATTTDLGAKRIVELATLGPDGPTCTFSNLQGPIAW